MKLKHKRECTLKRKIVLRDTDGTKYASFSDEGISIEATVYSGGGQLISKQSGIIQQYQKKILIDDPYIVTNENGVETYWFREKEYSMAAGDGICIYSSPVQPPDYRIAAIYPVGHLKVLLEKI